MSKRQLLCVLGVWVIIFLFLGFPSAWHKIIAIISGLAIIGLSYTFPPDRSTNPSQSSSHSQETFVENKQP